MDFILQEIVEESKDREILALAGLERQVIRSNVLEMWNGQTHYNLKKDETEEEWLNFMSTITFDKAGLKKITRKSNLKLLLIFLDKINKISEKFADDNYDSNCSSDKKSADSYVRIDFDSDYIVKYSLKYRKWDIVNFFSEKGTRVCYIDELDEFYDMSMEDKINFLDWIYKYDLENINNLEVDTVEDFTIFEWFLSKGIPPKNIDDYLFHADLKVLTWYLNNGYKFSINSILSENGADPEIIKFLAEHAELTSKIDYNLLKDYPEAVEILKKRV